MDDVSWEGINLLPWREKRKRNNIKISAFKAFVVLIVAIISFFALKMEITNMNINQLKNNNYLIGKIKQLRLVNDKMNIRVARDRLLKNEMVKLVQQKQKKRRLVNFIATLSQVLPSTIVVNNIKLHAHGGSIVLCGGPGIEISKCMGILQQMRLIKSVKLNSLNTTGGDSTLAIISFDFR